MKKNIIQIKFPLNLYISNYWLNNFNSDDFDGKWNINELNKITNNIKKITNNFKNLNYYLKYKIFFIFISYIALYFTFIGIIFIFFEFLFTLIVNIGIIIFFYFFSLIFFFIKKFYFKRLLLENKKVIKYLNKLNDTVYHKIGINIIITFNFENIILIYYKNFEEYSEPSKGIIFDQNLFFEKFRTFNLNILNKSNFPNMNNLNINQIQDNDDLILNLENEYIFDTYENLN